MPALKEQRPNVQQSAAGAQKIAEKAAEMTSNNESVYQRHIDAIRVFNSSLHKKYRITLYELLIMVLFSAIVLMGEVVYRFNVWFLIDPATIAESEAKRLKINSNYFSSKKNLVNVLFVKQGWGWTSLVYAVLAYKIIRVTKVNKRDKFLKLTLRFAVATLWWVFFTQWFFGFPIMDRLFIATGGKCEGISSSSKLLSYIEKNPSIKNSLKKVEFETGSFLQPGPVMPWKEDDKAEQLFEAKVSSAICRRLGGSWFGGQDPSGHCFLLIHSSLVLLFEVMPAFDRLLRDLYLNNWVFRDLLEYSKSVKSVVIGVAFKDDDKIVTSEKSGSFLLQLLQMLVSPLFLVFFLISVWSWMLFVTSIYFHTFPELVIGTIMGYIGILLTHYIPRFIVKRSLN